MTLDPERNEFTAMPRYHSTRDKHEAGDVILPGNFGRIILEGGPGHALWTREMANEAFRQQRFPNKPSRLSSTFHTDNIATARAYRNQLTPGDTIYEVELVDPAAPVHRGNIHAVQGYPDQGMSQEHVFNGYWTGTVDFSVAEYPGVVWDEFVSPSPLRVLRIVE